LQKLICNTDDHLRNHGFLLDPEGWRLSPAYDINPSPNGTGLHLNISENDNSLSLQLALEVAEFFRLNQEKARRIITEVSDSVRQWPSIAKELGIPKAEQELLRRALQHAQE
jgi:serine/threonine-protein kinase HipA